MNGRFCKVKHHPPESYSDCIRACVATLTDDDSVPHTFNVPPDSDAAPCWVELRAYLASRGKNIVLFAHDYDPREFMKCNNPDVPYMLLHSNSFGPHAVICINDELVHDPAWATLSITGPMPMGIWITAVIV